MLLTRSHRRRCPQRKKAILALTAVCLAASVLLSPHGAAAQATPPVRATSRESNGVLIYEHRADALDRAPRLTLAPTPDATFGGADADPAFDLTYLFTTTLLRSGQVVTYSRIGSKLAVFAPDGRAERIIGRQGQGPGEFIRASIGLGVADSIVVVDVANRRINWVLAGRGVVAERSLALNFDAPLERVVGYLPSGFVVMTGAGRIQRGEAGRIVRPPTPVGVVSARDGTSRIVASVPDLEIAMVETRFRGRAGVNAMPLRHGRRAIVVAWDSLIAVHGAEDSAIDLLAADGRVVRRLVLPLRRRALTAQAREFVINAELRRFTGPQSEGLVDRAESERLAREAPFADSLPTIADLLVGHDGVLWIVDGLVPGEARWAATAVARDGAIVGRAQGAGGTPVAFGGGRVVLRREDADGVVSLAVHRLVASPTPR